MKLALKAGLATAALVAFAGITAPAQAGGRDFGGSIKDGYVAPMPTIHRAAAGPCYARADVGYSWSRKPDTTWPVFNEVFEGDADGDGFIGADEVWYRFEGDNVDGDLDNSWFGEVGAGCGQGSRGFRGEVMFGFRGSRDFEGIPNIYNGSRVGDPVGTPEPDVDDPMHTSIRSYTLMFNAYYDFGHYGPVVPYLGAGIGAAYHILDDVYFTQNPYLTNRIAGDRDLAFAWSLMAGLGYQVSDRAILDLGYRYIDMGKVTSERHDNAGFINPRVDFDDLRAHEIKIGLRYHFGGSRHAAAYEPLK